MALILVVDDEHHYLEILKLNLEAEGFTVITAEADSAGVLTSYVDEVEDLTEEKMFEIPKNINLFFSEDSIKSIKYPFYLNNL